MPSCASSHGNRPILGCAARGNRQRQDGSSRIRHRASVRARDGFIAFPLADARFETYLFSPDLETGKETAKALGLTIPQSLLLRADQVIQ